MENLEKYSPTELLHYINEAKKEHDNKKSLIIKYLDEIKEIENKINDVLKKIDIIENNYVKLMEELTKKN